MCFGNSKIEEKEEEDKVYVCVCVCAQVTHTNRLNVLLSRDSNSWQRLYPQSTVSMVGTECVPNKRKPGSSFIDCFPEEGER